MSLSQHVKVSVHFHGTTAKTEKCKNKLIRLACIYARGLPWVLTHPRYFTSPEVYFPRLELLLARACPFDCKRCIHFLPEYPENRPEPAEQVIADIRKLLDAVDRIDELKISGGDAFLYPELAKVLQFLSDSPKISRIVVISTGAVSPTPEVLALLPHKKIQILVENYGALSDKIGEFAALQNPSIRLMDTVFDSWQDFGDAACRNRTDIELDRQYDACRRERYSLLNGRLYACPRSAHGENLCFFTNPKQEYADVRHASDRGELLAQLRQLRRCSHLTACNHCNSCTPDFVTYDNSLRFKPNTAEKGDCSFETNR